MKKEDTVSISDSESANKMKVLFLTLIFALMTATGSQLLGNNLKDHTITGIHFKSSPSLSEDQAQRYELLLDIKRGDTFNYKKNRKSMKNLFQTGIFSNISTEIKFLPEKKLDVIYTLSYKYRIHNIRLKIAGGKTRGIKRSDLRNAIFSLRKNTWYEPGKMAKAQQEIKTFLGSRGYFNPDINYTVTVNHIHSRKTVSFHINPGKRTRVKNIAWSIPDQKMLRQIKQHFNEKNYIPYLFRRNLDKIRKLLKKKKFYFPDIKLTETFTNPEKSEVILTLVVTPGYKYEFIFEGIENKIDLIASVWEKKVFEKWAEKESRARILYHLRNKGYLNADAEIHSHTDQENKIKYITYSVNKKRRYRLGKVTFSGNKEFPDKDLRSKVKVDDLFFEKHFHIRSGSLVADREVLRLYYYYNGFPNATVGMNIHFPPKQAGIADIEFVITEGNKYRVKNLRIMGNSHLATDEILGVIKTKKDGPFVQQILNEDVERLKNYYHSKGFGSVAITFDLSQGNEKNIEVNIVEGPFSTLGNLIIIGASKQQRKLIERLFPLERGDSYDQIQIDAFKTEIENSSIFNEIKIVKLQKEGSRCDLMVKVVPDRSRYYGFGFGFDWKEQLGLRGTVEYQQRNIFNGYSSLSTIVQAGMNEQRGIISYDTPYFFKFKINSQFRIWMDDEVWPTYHFSRYGLRESLIKKLTANAYVLASVGLNHTKLTALEIYDTEVDHRNIPFYTGAFNLSYVRETRDNPFNPSTGDFFSADIKCGALRLVKNSVAQERLERGSIDEDVFGKNHYFAKLRWSYQKNIRIFKTGVLAFSMKSGLAFGNLSITERFFAGGVNSFRGVQNNKLGPYDVMVPDTTDLPFELQTDTDYVKKPKGGNCLLLFNLESTFPLSVIPGDDFYYSLFVDVGNVFEKPADFDMGDLKTAVGVSLKIKTELGPLRFDFGWQLGKRQLFNGKKEGGFAWHVGFGNVL